MANSGSMLKLMWNIIAKLLAKIGSYAEATVSGFELHKNRMPSAQSVSNELAQKFENDVIEAKAEVNDAKKTCSTFV